MPVQPADDKRSARMSVVRTSTVAATTLALGLAALGPAVAAQARVQAPAPPTVVSVSRAPQTLVINGTGHSGYLTIKAHVTSSSAVSLVQWALEQTPGTYSDSG